MGNHLSCTSAMPGTRSSKPPRVVFPGLVVRQFRQPIKAAEVMLECPNFFLTNSQSLKIGRRFLPLSADEELEFGNLYIMFPMKRVNSVVTGIDMAVLLAVVNSASRRVAGGKGRSLQKARVKGLAEETMGPHEGRASRSSVFFPENDGDKNSDLYYSVNETNYGFSRPDFNYRISVSRSRKPLLETIKEEPVRSR